MTERVYAITVINPDGKQIVRLVNADDVAAHPDPAEALKVAAILAIDDLLEEEVPSEA